MNARLLELDNQILFDFVNDCNQNSYESSLKDKALDILSKRGVLNKESSLRNTQNKYVIYQLKDIKRDFKRIGRLSLIFYIFCFIFTYCITIAPSMLGAVMLVLFAVSYVNIYILMHSVYNDFNRLSKGETHRNFSQFLLIAVGLPLCFISYYLIVYSMKNMIEQKQQKNR